jgi:succinate dehydrogenase/fumarate reductase flavoprotein subunit
MKHWVVAVVAVLGGCAGGGITKQELESVRTELLANDERKAAELRQLLTDIDQKYVRVQQLEQEVNRKLEELNKLQKEVGELSKRLDVKVDLANTNVVKVLEFEEKLLAERLATVRSMIEDLKKNANPK